MRFWDSSALVPLLVEEQQSDYCLELLRTDAGILVWCLSRVEIISALCRRLRDELLTMPEFQQAKSNLLRILDQSFEVNALENVRSRALRLLEVHPLRAAEACQLSAALVASQEQPDRLQFVCFDDRLKLAAEKEGFILNPSDF